MKRLETLAVALALLMPAVAATGNGNTVSVDIDLEASGMSISGGEIDQTTFAYNCVSGNDNEVHQEIDLNIDETSLVGPDGPWAQQYLEEEQGGVPIVGTSPATFRQEAKMAGSVAGSGNQVTQKIELGSSENRMALGAFHGLGQTVSMSGLQSAEVTGTGNGLSQETCNGLNGNSITMAYLGQASRLIAMVEGNSNEMEQKANQGAENNRIANRDPYVMGWMNQNIGNEACINGNANEIMAEALQFASENSVADGKLTQKIDQAILVDGSNSNLNQDISQKSEGNSVADGSLLQVSVANSNQ